MLAWQTTQRLALACLPIDGRMKPELRPCERKGKEKLGEREQAALHSDILTRVKYIKDWVAVEPVAELFTSPGKTIQIWIDSGDED